MEQRKRASHAESGRIKQKLDKLADDIKRLPSERKKELKKLMGKRLYTCQEAAELLGISFPSIRRAIALGRLKIVRLSRFVRVTADEIARLMLESEETLSVAEASEVLNISPPLVRILIKQGKIRGFRFADCGRFRIPRNEVERIAQEGVA